MFEGKDQAHFIINGVKITFFNFPYRIPAKRVMEGIKMPDLLTLGAMKIFTLEGKWRNYVDLYFLLKSGIKLVDIISLTDELFNSTNSTLFNYRNFMEQLMYYDDVSYEEEVVYVGEMRPSNEQIKNYLTKVSIDYLSDEIKKS